MLLKLLLIATVLFPAHAGPTVNAIDMFPVYNTENPAVVALTDDPFTLTGRISWGSNEPTNGTLDWQFEFDGAVVETGTQLVQCEKAAWNCTLPSTIESSIFFFENSGSRMVTLKITFSSSGNLEKNLKKVSFHTLPAGVTLLPVFLVIIMAAISKNVYVSIYSSILLGAFLINGYSFKIAFEESLTKYLVDSAASSSHQQVILFSVFLAGLVAIMQRSGGALGFALAICKFANTAMHAQLSAFFSGLVIFFDDYANAMVIGNTFRPVTDALHVSREKLAFIADATSAPIASIIPLSSWIGFELEQIQKQLDAIKVSNGGVMPEGLTDNSFIFFVDTIPSRFYPIFMLVFQFAIIVTGIEFGPMLFAERRCRVSQSTDGGSGAITSVSGEAGEKKMQPEEDTPRKWWNMILPVTMMVCILLSVMIMTGQQGVEADELEMTLRNIFSKGDPYYSLVYSSFGASIFAIGLYLVQFKQNGKITLPDVRLCCQKGSSIEQVEVEEKLEMVEEGTVSVVDTPKRPLVYFNEAVEVWILGVIYMTPAIIVLLLAWAVGAMVTDIGIDRYFARVIGQGSLQAQYLQTIVFLLSSFCAAATGTSWGTMGIMFPIVSPAAWILCAGDVTLYTQTMSAILSGAVFGDHCSPISDTTLLSSVASGCKLGNHVITQAPYGCWVALWAVLLGSLPAGAGLPVGVCIVLGSVVMVAATVAVGAPVINISGRFDVFSELFQKFRKSQVTEELREGARRRAEETGEVGFDILNITFLSKKSTEQRDL